MGVEHGYNVALMYRHWNKGRGTMMISMLLLGVFFAGAIVGWFCGVATIVFYVAQGPS
jgi:hypothetical protein